MKKPISYYTVLICEIIMIIMILLLLLGFIGLVIYSPKDEYGSGNVTTVTRMLQLFETRTSKYALVASLLLFLVKFVLSIVTMIMLVKHKLILLYIFSIIHFLISLLVSYDLLLSFVVLIVVIFSKQLKVYIKNTQLTDKQKQSN